MGTAIKHPVPDWAKLLLVIFDIRALWRSGMRVIVPGCQKFQMTTLQMFYTSCWSVLKGVWFLLVCQGDERAAVTQLVCHVHYHPDAVARWVRLAQLLLSQFADTHQSAVAHCCRVAVGSATVSMHSVRNRCYCSLKPGSQKTQGPG